MIRNGHRSGMMLLSQFWSAAKKPIKMPSDEDSHPIVNLSLGSPEMDFCLSLWRSQETVIESANVPTQIDKYPILSCCGAKRRDDKMECIPCKNALIMGALYRLAPSTSSYADAPQKTQSGHCEPAARVTTKWIRICDRSLLALSSLHCGLDDRLSCFSTATDICYAVISPLSRDSISLFIFLLMRARVLWRTRKYEDIARV